MTGRGQSLIWTCAAALTFLATAQGRPGVVLVTVQTELGNIELAIDSAHAPLSAANFLKYVDGGHYESGRFHRTVTSTNQETSPVKIAVIQAGVAPGRTRPGFGPIALERTSMTGLKHLDGTISMARGGPDTATSDFFICIGDQPELDFAGKRNGDGQGFAAFGMVTSGMDIVRKIHAAPAKGQTLDPPVKIVNIVRKG